MFSFCWHSFISFKLHYWLVCASHNFLCENQLRFTLHFCFFPWFLFMSNFLCSEGEGEGASYAKFLLARTWLYSAHRYVRYSTSSLNLNVSGSAPLASKKLSVGKLPRVKDRAVLLWENMKQDMDWKSSQRGVQLTILVIERQQFFCPTLGSRTTGRLDERLKEKLLWKAGYCDTKNFSFTPAIRA